MNEADIRKMGETVGQFLDMGIAGGLVDNNRHTVQAFRGLYEKLKYLRDFDLIDEEDYYNQLEELRDRYFAVGTDNWVKYTKQIYSYQKKTLEEERKNLEAEKKSIQGLYDDIADYAVKKLDEVIKKQEKLSEKINNSGAFFKQNKVIIGDTVDYYYSLGDMERDIETVKRYGEDFVKLEERIGGLGDGVGGSILDKVKSMDFYDALGYMRALLLANDADFSQYVSGVDMKESLSESISAGQYEKEFSDAWDSSYENMKKKLEQAGYEIPDGFYVSGSLSAQRFGQAFIDELDLQLESVRERIDEFNSKLLSEVDVNIGGNTYNTNNTSYNITSGQYEDIVDYIRRSNLFKRLAGFE